MGFWQKATPRPNGFSRAELRSRLDRRDNAAINAAGFPYKRDYLTNRYLTTNSYFPYNNFSATSFHVFTLS